MSRYGRSPEKPLKQFSGTNAAISPNSPETAHCQSSLQEGAGEHHRPNYHYKRCSTLGVFLGSTATMVKQSGSSCVNAYGICRYTPPPPSDPSSEDNHLESTNYENSTLFLLSCFQYVLIAAVFSIGPPYRKSMWTNGACGICVGRCCLI